MHLLLNSHEATPIYLQIAQGIRRQIAAGELAPGSLLPTVRDLAQELGVNQNTVLRAYGLLRDEGLLEGRASLGTRVAATAHSETVQAAREAELRLLASRFFSEALSRGYALAEVEAAFVSQRSRWAETPAAARSTTKTSPILGLGSNDPCLDMLIGRFREAHPERPVSFASVGSLAGLLALVRGEVHFAAAHLYDPESGDYNAPTLRELAPGRRFDLITLALRTQGLLVARGNPRDLRNVSDLARPGVRIVNRQRGSGTHRLLGQMLQQAGIDASAVSGYDREEQTHGAVAAAVAEGRADAGLGIQAAAAFFDLDFVPLAQERYEVILAAGDPLTPLLAEIMARADFCQAGRALGGYDLSGSGTVRSVS